MHAWRIFRGAVYEWNEDKVPRMAAAIAFYTLFALTPIMIVAMAIGSTMFDEALVRREVLDQVRFLIGEQGTAAIQLLIKNAPEQQGGWGATFVGLATLFFAATGVFVELKDSLNTIWEVRPKPGLGLVEMIKDRLLSFAMVLVIGFLLLVSLVTSAMLSALGRQLSLYLPLPVGFWTAGDFLVSFGVITLLFALIYHSLPDAVVAWRHVWLGAAVTALLFVFGKMLFGWYLGHSTIGSSYGAAGSLVIVVLWTYYSSLILLFGAEVSFVAAQQAGAKVVPVALAVHVDEHDRVQQGIPHRDQVLASIEHERQTSTAEIDLASPPPRGGRPWDSAMLCFLSGWLLGQRQNRPSDTIDNPPRDEPTAADRKTSSR